MRYGNLPTEILELDVSNSWDYHSPKMNLRQLLDECLEEDILYATWEVEEDGIFSELNSLMFWTESEVGIMFTEHGAKSIMFISRNPPV